MGRVSRPKGWVGWASLDWTAWQDAARLLWYASARAVLRLTVPIGVVTWLWLLVVFGWLRCSGFVAVGSSWSRTPGRLLALLLDALSLCFPPHVSTFGISLCL